MQSGDYLRSMHDSGAFGPEPVYAKVLRVNRVTVTVVQESGDITRLRKEFAEDCLLPQGDWHPEIERKAI